MRLLGRSIDVALPCGLSGRGGTYSHRATIVALDGAAELLASEAENPFTAAHIILARCAPHLGNAATTATDDVRRLHPLDRDIMLIELTRLTFGAVRYETLNCPVPDCGAKMDVELDLSTVEVPEVRLLEDRESSLPDGRRVRLRLPTAGDQEDIYDVEASRRADGMLRRCLVTGDERFITSIDGLSSSERVACAAALGESSPRLDLTLELTCVECEGSFLHSYDPVRGLLSQLHGSRGELLAEIHTLALYYHWPHREILELPRGLRREYLGLLEQEFTQGDGL